MSDTLLSRHQKNTLSTFAGFVTALMVVISCNRLPDPAFTISPEEDPEAGDTLLFLNETRNAHEFLWEFGDGNTSRLEQPAHVYQEAGIFRVKLTAFNDAGDNTLEEPVTIYEPTVLSFIVTDSTGTINLRGAGVSVYDDREDFLASAEPLLFCQTDSVGRCSFSNVDPVEYYIRVQKQEEVGFWDAEGSTGLVDKHRTSVFRVRCSWYGDQSPRSPGT